MENAEALKFAEEMRDKLSYRLECAQKVPARSYYEKQYEMLNRAIAALREQEQSKWISVKEQPPERFVCVLCYCPNKDYGTKIVVSHNEAKAGENAYFADQHWFGEVTH